MRSIWTGSIGFGLVSIPIKLFSAVQETRLDKAKGDDLYDQLMSSLNAKKGA